MSGRPEEREKEERREKTATATKSKENVKGSKEEVERTKTRSKEKTPLKGSESKKGNKTKSGKSNEKEKKKKTKGKKKTEEDEGKAAEEGETKEKNEGEEGKEEEEEEEICPYGPQHAVKVVIPVTICVWIAVFLVATIFSNPTSGVKSVRQNSIYNTVKEEKGQGVWDTVWRTVVNALIILGIIIAATCTMLALYYFKLYKILWGFLGVSIITALLMGSFIVCRIVFSVIAVPVSFITWAFIALNVVVCCSMTILWKGPLRLAQASSIYFAIDAALIVFMLLPEWTGWVVLSLLVVWDLVAVLAPFGPLKKFVEIAQERDERGDGPLAALVYTSGMIYFDDLKQLKPMRSTAGKEPQEDQEKAIKNEQPIEEPKEGENPVVEEKAEEEPEERNIQLGLGDFVFYTILVGKASETGCWTTIFSCYLTIISGLLATLMLLIMFKRALPALPISITFGIIFYFAGQYAMLPFQDVCNRQEMVF